MSSDRLKLGWTRVAFGDVARQVKDRIDPATTDLNRYVAGEHMDTDDLRIRRWGTVSDGYLGPAFHMRFRPGHVLYGSRRTYLRKVAIADFEGITANTTFVIETKDPNRLFPDLLPFVMQTESFHDHSIKKSKGSVNPYVNFADLASYEFSLPPLSEQRRLALVYQVPYIRNANVRWNAFDVALRTSKIPTAARRHPRLRRTPCREVCIVARPDPRSLLPDGSTSPSPSWGP